MLKTKERISESELYHPIRDYLVAQGYTVRGEVKNCDITATKGDDLVVIELKTRFSTALLVQATQRQRFTDSVYVALPFPDEGIWSKKWRNIQHLLRRLEIGLIFVDPSSAGPSVQIVFHPLPFDRKRRKDKKRAVIEEIQARSGDYNEGGIVRHEIITAYRENAIHVACCLETHGPLSPRQLRDLGTGPKTQSILYNNHYGWFERVDRGLYGLRSTAKKELEKYSEIVDAIRQKLDLKP